MTTSSGPTPRAPALHADTPKGPWGGPGDGGGGNGGGGPRNPWSVPPKGGKPSALDDFLSRARRAGGGGPGGGGGRGPHLPANTRSLWLLGAGVLIVGWLLVTAVHRIGPQQRGVLTYFGRYAGTLDPGYRITLPAPVASVTKVDVQNIRTDNFPEGGGENLVLTGDQNIIDLAYSVRWRVSNPENYVFQIARPEETVRAASEAVMREVVANVTLDEAITTGRTGIEQQMMERVQRVLDDYHSGVLVEGVAISKADPPEQVNDAFKDVTAAKSDAAAAQNQAQTYAQQKVALAQGDAAAFDAYYQQYKLAPEVTRRRMYYETMEEVLSRTDKTIVEAPGVLPYLPLHNARTLPDAGDVPAASAAPATGGGQ